MTDRPNSRYCADTDVNQINQNQVNVAAGSQSLGPIV